MGRPGGLAFNLPRCHPQRIPADGFVRQLRAQRSGSIDRFVPGAAVQSEVTARNNADSPRPVFSWVPFTGAVGIANVGARPLLQEVGCFL
jgi:hypothetical protein